MFRITEDPSSGSLVQCLAKNYKNDSIVSIDMDNGLDRIILVIFSQALYKAPRWWILCGALLNIL